MALPQRVAVVTGASSGIGKGIAVELGQAGFCVYTLGRRSRVDGATSDSPIVQGEDLSIEATAEAVSAAGGRGVALQCDVSNDDAVESAISVVAAAEGRLDVLVCSAYSVPQTKLRDDFWKQGMEMWDTINNVGLRSVYATCIAATPLLIKTAALEVSAATTPLVVLISSFGGRSFTFNVAYGVGKAAIDRLASDMSVQLRKHRVATTALYPGLVRTEANLQLQREGKWAEASGGMDLFSGSESPAFSGRAVVALAGLEPEKMLARSGSVEVVAELASEFGFSDADGSSPSSIRSLKYLLPNFVFPQVEADSGKPVPAWIRENVPDVLLPWSIFSGGPPPEKEP